VCGSRSLPSFVFSEGTSKACASTDCEAHKCSFLLRSGGDIATTRHLSVSSIHSPFYSGRRHRKIDPLELSVAVYRLMRREIFEPDDVRLLAGVYEDVVKTLGLDEEKDALKQQVEKSSR
jgi:hypothetical protein